MQTFNIGVVTIIEETLEELTQIGLQREALQRAQADRANLEGLNVVPSSTNLSSVNIMSRLVAGPTSMKPQKPIVCLRPKTPTTPTTPTTLTTPTNELTFVDVMNTKSQLVYNAYTRGKDTSKKQHKLCGKLSFTKK